MKIKPDARVGAVKLVPSRVLFNSRNGDFMVFVPYKNIRVFMLNLTNHRILKLHCLQFMQFCCRAVC